MTEVYEHVEDILSLCGEASSGKESLELLRCVRIYVYVCVCVCVCACVCVHTCSSYMTLIGVHEMRG